MCLHVFFHDTRRRKKTTSQVKLSLSMTWRVSCSKFMHASLLPQMDRKLATQASLRGSNGSCTHTCRRMVQQCARVMSMNIMAFLICVTRWHDEGVSSRRASYGGAHCPPRRGWSCAFCNCPAWRYLRALCVPFVYVYPFHKYRTFPCRFQTIVDRVILASIQFVDQEPHLSVLRLRDQTKVKSHASDGVMDLRSIQGSSATRQIQQMCCPVSNAPNWYRFSLLVVTIFWCQLNQDHVSIVKFSTSIRFQCRLIHFYLFLSHSLLFVFDREKLDLLVLTCVPRFVMLFDRWISVSFQHLYNECFSRIPISRISWNVFESYHLSLSVEIFRIKSQSTGSGKTFFIPWWLIFSSWLSRLRLDHAYSPCTVVNRTLNKFCFDFLIVY